MAHFRQLAASLMEQILQETEQPEMEKIHSGEYGFVQNTFIENLGGDWYYNVHGEHVMFQNRVSGQTLEVFLFNRESLGDLDPYFFHQFLKTTPQYQHLALLFPLAYQDMVCFLDEMTKQGQMLCLDPHRYRRVEIKSSTPVIRKYNKSDESDVLALLRLNIPRYFAPEEENDLLYYLKNEAENYYVMELDGELVGCGGFNFSEDGTVGKISWDFFHPEHQGKGLGTQLTHFRIQKLKEFPQVKTISVRTSQLAYQFYEKLGFVTQEIVKDYWAKGFDMVRMELGTDN